MHSKTFFNEFLNNESDRDILKAQYLCISTHIRKRNAQVENAICLTNKLYPGSRVLDKGSFDEMRDVYFDQLNEEALPLIAELVRGSIEDDLNVILLCTKKEWKLKYLKWLAEFIMSEFEYPVYNYCKYIQGCPLFEYNKKKCLKKATSISEEAKQKLFDIQRKNSNGRKMILKEYKSMSKKELKALCIKEELYYEGMSKDEMLDMLEAFL
jgi:hypothetical protein